ncbi:hypothetical protein PR002_g15125 [Phytophthora rubi]|uniref:Secreted protein n=1 Tax=Phytophthora rubi TaxID=129364 RepID=A0A6A3L5V4_9STRA|nr:hypothetical protein PR002_g15125 [Phytophthora rubi]
MDFYFSLFLCWFCYSSDAGCAAIRCLSQLAVVTPLSTSTTAISSTSYCRSRPAVLLEWVCNPLPPSLRDWLHLVPKVNTHTLMTVGYLGLFTEANCTTDIQVIGSTICCNAAGSK